MPPDPETVEPRQSSGSSPDPTNSHGTTQTPGEALSSPSSREVAVEEAYNYWQKDWQQPPPPPGDEPGYEGEGSPEMRKMSFLDHLEELRHRLFYSLISIVVGFMFCFT